MTTMSGDRDGVQNRTVLEPIIRVFWPAQMAKGKMRRFYFVVWGINTVALVWTLGSILLYGSTPGRQGMAGDLTEIWAGLAAIYAWVLFRSRRKAKRERGESGASR